MEVDAPSVLVVVPTLGNSVLLIEALTAIDRQRVDLNLELVVVSQGPLEDDLVAVIDRYADRHLAMPEALGFAAANNVAMGPAIPAGRAAEQATSNNQAPAFIATVNDDAIVADHWLALLVETLTSRPDVASVQGINLTLNQSNSEQRIDGAGLLWNRWLQAIQIGHGETPAEPPFDAAPREVFGVSATAAVYRATALGRVAFTADLGPGGAAVEHQVFDEKLGTYYEDVDLACRLRRDGWAALAVPGASCQHAGSHSAPPQRSELLVANRHLVLARHLGRGYLPRLPWLLLRDLRDFGPSALSGWTRAMSLLPGFMNWKRGLSLRSSNPLSTPSDGVH